MLLWHTHTVPRLHNSWPVASLLEGWVGSVVSHTQHQHNIMTVMSWLLAALVRRCFKDEYIQTDLLLTFSFLSLWIDFLIWVSLLLSPFSNPSVNAGARESGRWEAPGGGAEEEVQGEREADPRSAGKSEKTANAAAAAGEWSIFSKGRGRTVTVTHFGSVFFFLPPIKTSAKPPEPAYIIITSAMIAPQNMLNTNTHNWPAGPEPDKIPWSCGNQMLVSCFERVWVLNRI